MKYFLDTEFVEGPQEPKLLILKSRLGRWMIGKPKPTIDLISIGIVSEDGREYYAISKDFNLKEAWNRFDLVQQSGDMRNIFPEGKKVYWLRENVFKSIWRELFKKYQLTNDVYSKSQADEFVKFVDSGSADKSFTFKSFKSLLNLYGKTNKEIAEEVKEFCHFWKTLDSGRSLQNHPIEFYAYYADYDWVVFCWLFGIMNDLPESFPQYCKDLKQMMDDKIEFWVNQHKLLKTEGFQMNTEILKKHPNYPKQENEHSAIEDARWNKQLYEFLKQL